MTKSYPGVGLVPCTCRAPAEITHISRHERKYTRREKRSESCQKSKPDTNLGYFHQPLHLSIRMFSLLIARSCHAQEGTNAFHFGQGKCKALSSGRSILHLQARR